MGATHFSGPVYSTGGFGVGDPTKDPPAEDTLIPKIMSGAGVPTMNAPKGSIYINTTGSSASTRVLVNVDGATGWTPLTAGA